MIDGTLRKLTIQVVAEDTAGYDTPYLGQHGISILLTAEHDAGVYRILVDVAQNPEALLENMGRMGIDPKAIDALVLTHCHYDHTRGMARIVAAVGRTDLPVVAHPGLFRPHFVTEPVLTPIGVSTGDDPEQIRAAGGRLQLSRDPLPLAPGLCTTGEVPRQTDFETVGMPLWTLADGRLVPDLMADDISVIARVDGCGAVIVTGCSHAGIVNICRCARDLTGSPGIHGIIGGLHLVSADEEKIEKTVAALAQIAPDWIHAGHCTGFRAQAALHARFGQRFAPMYTGMRITIDADAARPAARRA